MANVTIEIDAIDQTGKAFNNINSNLGNLNKTAEKSKLTWTDFRSAYSTAMDALRLGEQALDMTYGKFSDLTDSVRDFSLVSGESAEDASRFIQVLDDFGLTAEDATVAAKKLKDQGLSPNIDTLAMLADEFKKIKDPAERFDFIQDNLGKGGKNWVNILDQTSDSLRANAAAVSANLIITEQDIRMREAQRLAMDSVKDSLDGMLVSLGKNTSNVLALGIAHMRAMEILNSSGGTIKDYNAALEQAIAEQLQAADTSMQYEESLKAQEEALKNTAQANKDQLNAVMALTKAYQDSAAVGSAASRQRLIDMTLEKIEMLDGAAGFSQAEQEKAMAFAETAGVAEASAMREVIAIDSVSSAIANGTRSAEDMKGILESLTKHTWSVQVAVQMQSLENLRSTLGANAAANPGRTYYQGGKAEGGPIKAGGAYMVGERGPEMIVPSSNGNVVPNNQLGGGIDYNRLTRAFVTAMERVGR